MARIDPELIRVDDHPLELLWASTISVKHARSFIIPIAISLSFLHLDLGRGSVRSSVALDGQESLGLC